ncbi:MAG: ceramidase [Xanthomonadales bacterium]|nr:ceramidase [Xanthomonadales bacterium]
MMVAENPRTGLWLIAILTIASSLSLLFIEPIPQDISYHLFSDVKPAFGIPNFWNVLSNIAFAVVGILGLYNIYVSKSLVLIDSIRLSYALFFAGVSLVALGSGYYHLWPDNQTLVWDRLPMTIAFMALFSILICEFISERVGKVLLIPLILVGIASVFYWGYTEDQGVGDLRLYALVQFLPIVIIPVILVFFSSQFTKISGYWLLLLVYLAAKAFEHFDAQIFSALGFISGHSLKHIAAALGTYLLLLSYQRRLQLKPKHQN